VLTLFVGVLGKSTTVGVVRFEEGGGVPDLGLLLEGEGVRFVASKPVGKSIERTSGTEGVVASSTVSA